MVTNMTATNGNESMGESMEVAINFTLSRLRMFASVMARITWATDPNTALRFDTLNLTYAIEETLVWLDGERARFASEPALAERIEALFHETSVTIEAEALAGQTLH